MRNTRKNREVPFLLVGACLPFLASVLLSCCTVSSGRTSTGSPISETPRDQGSEGQSSAAPLTPQAAPLPICGVGTDVIAKTVKTGLMRASPQGPGCLECPDPSFFFSGRGAGEEALEKRISTAAQVMKKIRRKLHLDPASDADVPPAGLPDPDALHQRIAREMEELRRSGEAKWYSLYPAVCFTSPAFRDAFAPFTEQLLSSAKQGEAPPVADGKDPDLTGATVFLAMEILDQRTLCSLVRFIRSGQHSEARENVVRNICAFAMTAELRAALQWVVDDDPAFRSKALKCLRAHGPQQPGE